MRTLLSGGLANGWVHGQPVRRVGQLPALVSVLQRLKYPRINEECSTIARRCIDPRQRRRARHLVVRRTSEHWWEDEEEFDAITEMVLPKRMHVAIVTQQTGASAQPGPRTGTDAWAAASDAAVAAMMDAAGGKFASGFSSSKSKELADALWHRMGQDGPPFFKKVRTRSSLDVLEEPSSSEERVSAAAEELWLEMCGQTWRVELDYGLAGSETEPRDQLLVACSGLAARRLLSHADLHESEVDRDSGYVVVDVGGYNAASVDEQRGSGSLQGWRGLKPRLLSCSPAGAV